MFVNTLCRRITFNLVLFSCISFIYIWIFYPIYTSNNIIITFAVHPFNICQKYPDVWNTLKISFIPISITSSLICINLIYSYIFTKKNLYSKSKKPLSDLSLFIANDTYNQPIFLPESSLYQNILITGTIGSGKTSSAMYPFTRQLIKYKYDDDMHKIGMLILDVKGNYYSQVQKYAKYYRRQDDLVVIELRW